MCPHIKYTASKKLLEVDYEVPSNEEKYPENSDAMRYFRELSQKIESIMN
jgi:hypothetical protein